MTWEVKHGDNRELLASLDADSVDAVVCDPPYELGFMGKKWDSSGIAYDVEFWREVYRVLKPGAHLVAFGGTRTYHRMAVAIEDAGFEIRDSLHWCYTQGFPKSLDISKALDKIDRIGPMEDRARAFTAWMRSTGITAKQINEATQTNMGSHYLTEKTQPAVATADLFDLIRPLLPPVPEEIEALVRSRTVEIENMKRRKVVGQSSVPKRPGFAGDIYGGDGTTHVIPITVPYTPEAQRARGLGTALKPAHEPIVLARKPFAGTVAANVLQWGTGAINVEGCRVATDDGFEDQWDKPVSTNIGAGTYISDGRQHTIDPTAYKPMGGRWPPNLLLSHAADCGDTCIPGCAVDEMERQSGSSRMFPCFRYEPKPSRGEREAGCEALPTRSGAEAVARDEGSAGTHSPAAGSGRVAERIANVHPTVKSIDLMRWLCRLVTPPAGLVVDPFCGSGTTGCAAVIEGFRFLGMEREAEYVAISQARISHWSGQTVAVDADKPSEKPMQMGLWGTR